MARRDRVADRGHQLGAGVARTGRGHHDSRGARVQAGPDEQSVRAGVDRHHVHPGQPGKAEVEGEPRAGARPPQRHHAPVHHAERRSAPGRGEGVRRQGVALAHPAGGEGEAVEDQQRAVPPGRVVGGHGQGVAEVGRAVGGTVVERTLGAGQHDRPRIVEGEVEQEGGLLHRVGAVGHDHSVGAVAQCVTHLAGRREQIAGVEGVAAPGAHVPDVHLHAVGQWADRRDQFLRLHGRPAALRLGPARDGAAGCHDPDTAHGALSSQSSAPGPGYRVLVRPRHSRACTKVRSTATWRRRSAMCPRKKTRKGAGRPSSRGASPGAVRRIRPGRAGSRGHAADRRRSRTRRPSGADRPGDPEGDLLQLIDDDTEPVVPDDGRKVLMSPSRTLPQLVPRAWPEPSCTRPTPSCRDRGGRIRPSRRRARRRGAGHGPRPRRDRGTCAQAGRGGCRPPRSGRRADRRRSRGTRRSPYPGHGREGRRSRRVRRRRGRRCHAPRSREGDPTR